jgi:peptidase M1-like protein
MVLRALLLIAMLGPASAAAQPRSSDAAAAVVEQLEAAAATGKPDAIIALGVSPDAPGLKFFSSLASPAPTRVIIKERDRAALEPSGERLLIEVFSEYGRESTITTWQLDLIPGTRSAAERQIREVEQLTTVSGLYKLAINPAKEFNVRNLTVTATDMALEMASGSAFVAETAEGTTAVVLLGRGRMRFAPSDPAEQTQIRIFSGEPQLATDFDAAFIRVRPSEFDDLFPAASLSPRTVSAGDLRRATDVFEEYIGQTFNIDLRDLSRERWSLIPTFGDLIAEVRTRRLGSLTYARSAKDAEDISLFDRKRRRNIAVYASQQKLGSRGRFYGEDELVEYDILRHDLEVAFSPDRVWVEGTARLRIRVRSLALSSLTLRLAESLNVRNVATEEQGRLLYLRVIGQNSVIINFPTALRRNTEISLYVAYGGRLEPQQIDREGIVLDQQGNVQQEDVYIPVEPQYIYSNRNYWYPQSTVTDYATSSLRITVPAEFDVIATGSEVGPPAPAPGAVPPGQRARKLYVFDSNRPIRYLSCVISRFTRVASRDVVLAAAGNGAPPAPVALNVQANPRQVSRGRGLVDRAAAVIEFYGSLIGEAPYSSFTLALTENDLPGGHSPAYFAILNQPLPLSPLVWRNDPVAFEGYPPYFLAHEIAHQWWGQGVGWKNYHEQWLSEGFAQYFAALYAARDRGDDVFRGMLRQMRRWAIDQSDQGPVYLGYRLGHIKGEGRVFRALVYNKGAMVLHMLRRLLGDDKFFEGLRQFYTTWKFRKAGTDDFRRVMEKISGQDLASFFDGWIYGSAVPEIGFSSTLTSTEARIRFEHRGTLIPTPVTVSILYVDGSLEDVVVAVSDRVVERTLPLKGPVRSIDANRDYSAVAEIGR